MRTVLRQIVKEFPQAMHRRQLEDVPRVAFNLELAFAGRDPHGLSICDVGGGLGLFVAAAASLGARATLIDDFSDEAHFRVGESVVEIYRRYGVEIISRDVVGNGLGDYVSAFDTVAAFDTVEHWHHSPKRVFRQILTALKPDGVFVLATPNCVNIRKRIVWPLGLGQWSAMKDWYDADVFRGHVREPSVRDLRYIADDLKLRDAKIYGRNWMGHRGSRARKLVTTLIERPLQLRPSLCANIYLTGLRPHEVTPP